MASQVKQDSELPAVPADNDSMNKSLAAGSSGSLLAGQVKLDSELPAVPAGNDSMNESLAAGFSGPLLLVGCAQPVPGQTKQSGTEAILRALDLAASGVRVLHPSGQRGEWLHKCFIATQLGVGAKTWKHFKKTQAARIELDDQHQWVRLKDHGPADVEGGS